MSEATSYSEFYETNARRVCADRGVVQLGMVIANEVFPDAIDFYEGKVDDDDLSDVDDEDEDEEDEEEDEDEEAEIDLEKPEPKKQKRA